MSDEKRRQQDYLLNIDEKDERNFAPSSASRSPTPAVASPNMANNPVFPILAYCGSSILMTVTNKYVLSGTGFNLNFFLLCVQVGFAVFLPSDTVG